MRLQPSGAVRSRRRVFGWLVLSALLLLFPLQAGAELVFFVNGRTVSISGYEVEGDAITLRLRDGGEVTCKRSLVARIAPDEMPEPLPAMEAATNADAVRQNRGPVLSGRPFAALISSVAAAHGIDPRLVHAVVEAESNYHATARSRKGAKGLMQLMPDTAEQYALRNPYDPRANLEAGVRHLKRLLGRFDLAVALAAYNAGEAVVQRYGGMPPFAETRSYVRQILARLSDG